MKRKKKRVLKFFCFLSAFLILAVSIYFSSNKIVIEFAAKSFDSMISAASYHAVDALIEKKYKYSDLVDIKTDNDGKISMVVTDSYEVNKLAAIVATNAYDYLSEAFKRVRNKGKDESYFGFVRQMRFCFRFYSGGNKSDKAFDVYKYKLRRQFRYENGDEGNKRRNFDSCFRQSYRRESSRRYRQPDNDRKRKRGNVNIFKNGGFFFRFLFSNL